MSFARPIRALVLAGILLWCFFLYQVLLKPSLSTRGPGARYTNFERDPNLDRELLQPCFPPDWPTEDGAKNSKKRDDLAEELRLTAFASSHRRARRHPPSYVCQIRPRC